MTVQARVEIPSRSAFCLLGVRVDAVQIPDVIAQMEHWIAAKNGSHFIAVTTMHGLTEAHYDSTFKDILNAANLVVPDGMPLVWLGRLRGLSLPRRVYGPELMLTFCHQTAQKGYRHFFYGGAPGVPQRLAEALHRQFPALCVAGSYSPPFRPLTEEEDANIVELISRAAPDVLWVGLSELKQDRWMYEYRNRLNVPVLVGVGAAFDIHAGRAKQAPRWMREHGLEWFFRLVQEPRRLWRRYLVYGSKFAFLVTMEVIGIKKTN